jgi:hypothetical protein
VAFQLHHPGPRLRSGICDHGADDIQRGHDHEQAQLSAALTRSVRGTTCSTSSTRSGPEVLCPRLPAGARPFDRSLHASFGAPPITDRPALVGPQRAP